MRIYSEKAAEWLTHSVALPAMPVFELL